ncbi:MAG: YceI family protein [Saprospiraceae bacterium]|nr:YceI family protein [Saprospiraceae bacterium]
MSKFFILLFVVLGVLSGPAKEMMVVKPVRYFIRLDTMLCIDLERSRLFWKGTKLAGTGKHEGTLRFLDGNLMFEGGELVAGQLMVDMQSIHITDISPQDIVPIRNLTGHLKADFAVGQFPIAKLEIEQVTQISEMEVQIKALLTIRSITWSIDILVRKEKWDSDKYHFSSQFSFDRFDWNIGSEGSWLEKKLVDRDIQVGVDLFTM